MTLRPTVALHGSLPALQPEFYYSDVFLAPLRLDVDKLLTDFVQRLLNKPDQDGLPASSSPTDLTGASAEQNSFEIFKTCWLPLNFEYPHNLVATHLIATLISNKAFRVLPISDLHPLNPTVLPQTFVEISTTDQDTRPRGPGRVTLTQRLRTAKRAVDDLRALLDRDDPHMASRDIAPPPSSVNYTHLRALMLKAAGPENVADAIRETSQTLENAEVVLAQEGVAVEVDSEIRAGRLLDLVHEIRE
ncbi:small nuclear RNA activating complex (SNAPc), subunit SNAP43 [Ceratobasidium sp. AG-Ba]|nr:small nuclear RNA activating complex (SNAPc), subunit SNAP43 [Ceratobasidium sp. AG-Ba]QRW02937.1 small nuclear RNA activating complex (SNAPc), subunit SNAP43 [Ceratobasidium sp. AG-Ba]